MEELRGCCLELIRSCRRQLQADTDTDTDTDAGMSDTFAACYMRMVNPATGSPFTDEELVPDVIDIFVAGFDTSGHAAAHMVQVVLQLQIIQPVRMTMVVRTKTKMILKTT